MYTISATHGKVEVRDQCTAANFEPRLAIATGHYILRAEGDPRDWSNSEFEDYIDEAMMRLLRAHKATAGKHLYPVSASIIRAGMDQNGVGILEVQIVLADLRGWQCDCLSNADAEELEQHVANVLSDQMNEAQRLADENAGCNFEGFLLDSLDTNPPMTNAFKRHLRDVKEMMRGAKT